MLEGLKKVVPVAAFVALVLFFGNELWRSSNNPAQSAHQISEPHSAKKPNESKQDESQWYRRTFFWLTHDAAGFFTLWLVVVGGGQVLLFYVQLKLIREASDISAAQSKAIIAANSPVPVVAEIKLVPYNSWADVDGAADRVLAGQAIPEICRALIHIQNIGRNSMRITSFCIECRAVVELEPDPQYRRIDNNWQPWLTPFDGMWFRPADEVTAVNLSPQDRNDIQAGRRILWVYGYFTYLDVLGTSITHKFIARWDLTRGLVGERRPNYT